MKRRSLRGFKGFCVGAPEVLTSRPRAAPRDGAPRQLGLDTGGQLVVGVAQGAHALALELRGDGGRTMPFLSTRRSVSSASRASAPSGPQTSPRSRRAQGGSGMVLTSSGAISSTKEVGVGGVLGPSAGPRSLGVGAAGADAARDPVEGQQMAAWTPSETGSPAPRSAGASRRRWETSSRGTGGGWPARHRPRRRGEGCPAARPHRRGRRAKQLAGSALDPGVIDLAVGIATRNTRDRWRAGARPHV